MKLDRLVDIVFSYGVVGFPLAVIFTLYNLMVFVPLGGMSGSIILSTFGLSYFICVFFIFLFLRYNAWKRNAKGIKTFGFARKTKEDLVAAFCWLIAMLIISLFFMNRITIDRKERMKITGEKQLGLVASSRF